MQKDHPRERCGFLLYLVLGGAYLFTVYSPALFIKFAFHDQYRYFLPSSDSISGDPQFAWLVGIGRPLTAVVEGVVFSLVDKISDLTTVRIVVVACVVVTAALFARWLQGVTTSRATALLLSLAVFSLPGIQFHVFIGDVPNILAILFALLAYFSVEKFNPFGFPKPGASKYLVLGIVCFLISAFFYVPKAMFFLVPCLAAALFKDRLALSEGRERILRDLCVFAVGCIAYFVITKVFLAPRLDQDSIPANYRFSITTDIWKKLRLFKDTLTPIAFNLWNIQPDKTVLYSTAFVILTGLLSAFAKTVSQLGPREIVSALKRTALLIVFVFAVALSCNAPTLVARGSLVLYRILFAYTAAVVVLLVWSFRSFSELLPKALGQKIFLSLTLALCVAGGISAFDVTYHNALNARLEFAYICRAIKQNAAEGVRRIHVVRPEPSGVGFNGRRSSLGDEFNHNSTRFPQDIMFIVSTALSEAFPGKKINITSCPNAEKALRGVPGGTIAVTSGEFNEPVAPFPGTLVIDMNKLVRESREQKLCDPKRNTR